VGFEEIFSYIRHWLPPYYIIYLLILKNDSSLISTGASTKINYTIKSSW